jgi:hypothetical protein
VSPVDSRACSARTLSTVLWKELKQFVEDQHVPDYAKVAVDEFDAAPDFAARDAAVVRTMGGETVLVLTSAPSYAKALTGGAAPPARRAPR